MMFSRRCEASHLCVFVPQVDGSPHYSTLHFVIMHTFVLQQVLYCDLGAIILGLLIYVILRCRVNKKRAAHMAAHGGGHPSYQIVQPQQQQAPYYNTGVAHPPTSTSPIIYLDSNGKTGKFNCSISLSCNVCLLFRSNRASWQALMYFTCIAAGTVT